MIELSRREAGRFRALARRCVVGRSRGPSPSVFFRQAADALTLSIDLSEVVPHLRLPSGTGNEVALKAPLALLDAVAGNDPAASRIEVDTSGRIHARWTDRGQSREAVFDPVTAEDGPAPPDARLAQEVIAHPAMPLVPSCKLRRRQMVEGRPRRTESTEPVDLATQVTRRTA
jgi:hypothetical protein